MLKQRKQSTLTSQSKLATKWIIKCLCVCHWINLYSNWLVTASWVFRLWMCCCKMETGVVTGQYNS